MGLHIYSEIGPLKKVLVHAPGPEVDCMLPELMHRLLFDDILYGPRGRQEHRNFRSIMRAFGVEVTDTRDLLQEALEAEPGAIPELIRDIQRIEGLRFSVMERLQAMAPAELAAALVEGLPPGDGVDELQRDAPLPLPNLLFARDAGVVLGDRLAISNMKIPVRQREPLLLRHSFTHHPELRGTKILKDFTHPRSLERVPAMAAPTIEGGDVLILKEGIVLVGVSERTMEAAADQLVAALRGDERFRAVVLVNLPSVRHAMHLDTVFTRISDHECLVYAPMICEGSLGTASAVVIDLQAQDDWGRRHPSTLAALRSLGVDLEPVYCGGRTSLVQQAREQWTDGANTFALRPGVVILYERNRATAEELYKHGYEIVELSGLPFDEDGKCLRSFREGKRYALLLEGNELARARGGPRCMTMPLVREPV